MQNEVVILGKDVVEEARSWIGTPWVHQQAAKHHGCDCIGLIRGVGRDLEIVDFDADTKEGRLSLQYGRDPVPVNLIGGMNRYLIPVTYDVEQGDVILFAINNLHSHVGIITDVDKGIIIHTWLRTKKVIESSYHSYLKPAGVWRYPGVAHPQGEWR